MHFLLRSELNGLDKKGIMKNKYSSTDCKLQKQSREKKEEKAE